MTLVQSSPKKLYIRVEAQPVTTAGIYHSPEQWLISLSSDWSNWITISDKNLWATQVWNDGDTLSEANCGKYYQWWNNYGFPFTWPLQYQWSKVSASWYWPNNYYNNSMWNWYQLTTWISDNWDNLWGDTTDTVDARKWPCDTGFHIPSKTEQTNIKNILISLWKNDSSVKTLLKMPPCWYISDGLVVKSRDSIWYFWTSTALYNSYNVTNNGYGIMVSSWIANNSNIWTACWANIRPFKNTPVQPDSSRTVLYPTS